MTLPTGLAVPFVPGSTEGSAASNPITPPPVGDSAPLITVEVAFDSTAADPRPAWFDLADLASDGVAPVLDGNTSRGRSSERDAITAGSASVTLGNPDGYLTPNTQKGPLAGKVTVDKQTRVKVTPPMPYDVFAAYVFRGYAATWVADPQGGFEAARTTVTMTDNSDGLSLVTLSSDFATELGKAAPWGYWPMTEPDGADSIGEKSGNGRRNLPLRSWTGPSDVEGAFKFGDDPLAPSDAGTSLQLSPVLVGSGSAISTDSGRFIELGGLGPPARPAMSYANGFAFAIAFRTSTHVASGMSLIEANDSLGNNLVQVYLEGVDQKLMAFIFPNGTGVGGFTGPSAVGYADGKPHLLIASVLNDARTLNIFVDGVLIGSAFASVPDPSTVVNGRVTFGVGTGITSYGFPFGGSLGHLAIFDHSVSASRAAQLWQAWQGFPGEDADDRIIRYLGYATWVSGTRFDDAKTTLGVQKIDGLNVLDAINQAAASEQGLFFITGDGAAIFHSRQHRWNKPSRVTFDASLPVDRTGLTFTEDRQYIYNDITGTRPGGTTQRVVDDDSIEKHRHKTQNLQLAVLSDEELYSAVSYYKFRYAQPSVRVGSVTLDPYTNPALWQWALGLEIGDRITLDDLPASAPATVMDFYVESIAHDYSRSHFRTTLQLSPAIRQTFWQVGVPGFSEVGVSTLVGY